MNTCLTDTEQPGRAVGIVGVRLKALQFDRAIFETSVIYPHEDV